MTQFIIKILFFKKCLELVARPMENRETYTKMILVKLSTNEQRFKSISQMALKFLEQISLAIYGKRQCDFRDHEISWN